MAFKQALFNIKGMTRDLAASKFSPEYAFENKNMRIVATDSNTSGALVNEKGNLRVDDGIFAEGIEGTPIGQAVLNDELILFTTGIPQEEITTTETVSDVSTSIGRFGAYKRYTTYEDALWDVDGTVVFPTHSSGDYNYFAGLDGEYLGFTDIDGKRRVLSPITPGEGRPVIAVYVDEDSDDIYYVSELDLDVAFEDLPDISNNFNDKTISFTKTTLEGLSGKDAIYKLNFNDSGELVGEQLYKGNLNLSEEHPIESITVYENEKLKKVYWTDGYNQPRVINIAATQSVREAWTDDSFNFVREIQLNETINIERNTVAGGYFAPGVIQYAFSYYNLYGQETNLFYTSPLYYVSYNNRGASPEDTVSNSFTITISNPDSSFEFIRIYSIHRTSLNATPQVRKVADIAVPKSNNAAVTYIDDGEEGETIDPTRLFYIGGENIVAGTISQKDNTLFLGDIKYDSLIIPEDTQEDLRVFNFLQFEQQKTLNVLGASGGFYNYKSQLASSSEDIKGFKYLEWYRLGLQFQDKTGKWSKPVWIRDIKNTSARPSVSLYNNGELDSYIYRPVAHLQYSYDYRFAINKLLDLGYVRVRPVIVYPSISDREAVCQGILCPTVYNAEDRYGSSPFAQSSWFARPFAPCDISNEINGYTYDFTTATGYSINSKAGTLRLEDGTLNNTYYFNVINKGAWAEFRHNTALPASNQRNCEIQCMDSSLSPLIDKDVSSTSSASQSWASKNKEQFFVDQSILTFHSPDIEFDTQIRSLDSSNLKLRIVGTVPLTAFNSNIDIQTSTPPMNKELSAEVWPGFYQEPVNSENLTTQGWRGLISAPMWFDGCHNRNSSAHPYQDNTEFGWLYVVYPWHRTGSLNNTKAADSNGYLTAKLSQKKLCNSRFSYNSLYLDSNNIWYAYEENSQTHTGITGVQIFDSQELTPIKLPAQEEGLQEIVYYGNVDKVITYPSSGDKKDGYPIMISGYDEDTYLHNIYCSDYDIVSNGWVTINGVRTQVSDITDEDHSNSPISMKYKSTPHAVLALRNSAGHRQRILPTFKDYDLYNTYESANSTAPGSSTFDTKHYFWDKHNIIEGVSQDSISNLPSEGGSDQYYTYNTKYGFLWLGELYNDSVTEDTRFGGQTPDAFENNQWVIAGEPVKLSYIKSISNKIDIYWTEGDTYYQRYDCLKTYPFTNEDTNSVIDMVSFMCETRVNIDGRYDRNRGNTNNLYVSPNNFNLLNTVYSQDNNFFIYRAVNSDKLKLNNFPNTITWTKTKTLGEEVDSWTNITLASTLDLDGDLGSVKALRRFNDSILAFQDRGISQILYNENVQIASTTGVPIEIANSGKVSGKRYITNHIGCTNKWSICSTPNGLYFLDSINKDIYLFNGQLNNLSDRLGFHSWIINNLGTTNIWTPSEFESCITYYDKVNSEVLFITEDTCLAYSEGLSNFTSFYDYDNTPFFANLNDREIAIHKKANTNTYYPYLHREGDYNHFYDEYKPFWTTVVVNANPTTDKLFSNVQFEADGFNGDTYLKDYSFDTLHVWNEHQEGEAVLSNTKDKPSTLKKKFRLWRANIPRWTINKNGLTPNGRDRMRNPWLYLKLGVENTSNLNSNTKMVLHNLGVDYFE